MSKRMSHHRQESTCDSSLNKSVVVLSILIIGTIIIAMTEKRENTLVKGDIQKALIRMALPLMAFSLINVIYSFIDTYWVSKIGELQVGAISLVSTVNSCGTAFITGLSAGGMALMSRAIGANERQRANHIATILLTSSLILALLIGVFIVVFARDILAWLKTPQDIHEAAYLYLIGTATDFAGLFTITIFQAIRQSNGDSKSGVIINICAVILNAVLDPLMIITFNMGILGAALATSLSKALMIPLVLWALMKDTTVIHVNFRKYRFNLELFREIFRVSLPAATGSFLMDFGFIIMNRYIISYGSLILSAYGIGNRISSLFGIPTNALATALTPFIGQSIGAKDYQRTQQCLKSALKLGIIISVFVTVAGLLLTRPLTMLLITNASDYLLENSITYANFSVGTTVFMLWMNVLLAMFNGAGETGSSLMINVVRLWGLRIPMLYCFRNFTSLGPLGIWLSMILSNLIVCIIGQIWYEIHYRKKYGV